MLKQWKKFLAIALGIFLVLQYGTAVQTVNAAETAAETENVMENSSTAEDNSESAASVTTEVTESSESQSEEDTAAAVEETQTAEASAESSTETVSENSTETAAQNSTEAVTASGAETENEAAVSQESNSVTLFKTASGSTDITDAAVDSIDVQESVGTWTNFQVTVNFSEDDADGSQKSGMNIESGDKIYISWEAPEGITFTGYNATIELHMDGDSSKPVLGTAVVTDSGVEITFNDNVTGVQHVKGSVTFTIRNTGSLTSEDTTGKIIAGSIEKEIKINPGSSTGVVGFGSKGGSYATDGTNRIDWTIWINNEALTDITGDIVIEDTLPDTETFESFIGYSHRNGGLWNWAVHSLDDFNNNGRAFSVSGNTITITIPASELAGNTGLIHFYTTSTASAGDQVANNITMTHYDISSPTEPISNDYIGRVTVPTSSGTISGVPQGTIEVHKLVRGTTAPISGVWFRVYKVNSESDHTRQSGWYDGADYAEIQTGSDGVATLENLDDGYYEIEEIASDEEHVQPNWIVTSTLPESVVCSLAGTTGTAVTVYNDVKTTDISAEKIWKTADGSDDISEHPTTYLKLFRSISGGTAEDAGQEIKEIDTASGESSTTVTWKDLPQYDNSGNEYTYTVQEVDSEGNAVTPDGYTKNESGLTVINTRKESSREDQDTLTLNKTDESGNALDGATFTLYDGENALKTYTAGTATISSEDMKSYLGSADSKTFTLKETTAPDGYTASTQEYKITLTKSVEYQWEGEGEDRSYNTITTYTLDCDDAENDIITVSNQPVTGEREVSDALTLNKTDGSGNALDGATFTLYDGEDVLTTYTAGTATISSEDMIDALGDLTSKTFILRETAAPDGYAASTVDVLITLTKDVEQQWEGEGTDRKYMTVTTYTLSSDSAQDGTINVSDQPLTGNHEITASLGLVKTDENGNTIDGATFVLYDGETEVRTYNVGAATISSNDLKSYLGNADSKTFTLKETEAPDGYAVSTTEYSITLNRSVEQKWEGEGTDRRYNTVTTYTITCDSAENGLLTVVNQEEVLDTEEIDETEEINDTEETDETEEVYESEEIDETDETDETESTSASSSPDTGDFTPIGELLILFVASGSVIGVILRRRKHHKN